MYHIQFYTCGYHMYVGTEVCI